MRYHTEKKKNTTRKRTTDAYLYYSELITKQADEHGFPVNNKVAMFP